MNSSQIDKCVIVNVYACMPVCRHCHMQQVRLLQHVVGPRRADAQPADDDDDDEGDFEYE